MGRSAVVTVFLRHRGDVLLLERSPDTGTYPGRWAGVSGCVEDGDPAGTARLEVSEETGLDDAEFVRAGDPFVLRDEARGHEWRVHPFLAEAPSRDVTLNEESVTAEWTPPPSILRRETVPALWTAYDRVRPTPVTIAADRDHGAADLSIRALEVLRDDAGLAVARGDSIPVVRDVARALVTARPSMPVLATRIDRIMSTATTPTGIERAAIDGIDRALDADEEAAAAAANRVPGSVLTLSRSGTVTATLTAAAPDVVIAESRPGREGVGVAESLTAAGLDVTVCPDAAVAHVLSTGAVEAVIVGADAILPDARVVNKVGTRGAAIAATRANLPVYVAASIDKVSPDDDPLLEAGEASAVYDGPAPIDVENPTFDVTPADCVDAVLTERGPLAPDDVVDIAEEHAALRSWRQSGG